MPFPPDLGADPDSANPAFIATVAAYLAAQAPLRDLPAMVASFTGIAGDSEVAVAGTRLAGAEFPLTAGSYLAGFLGFVGGPDDVLPDPPIPDYGPIGSSTSAAGNPFPPVLGTDPDAGNSRFVATFQGYLASMPEASQFPLRLIGAFDVADPQAGDLVLNQINDPGASYAQLDGQFDVFAGQPQPPFATTRLPRLAFGPFLVLSGLTYQVEVAAFAKFGLTRIQYRIHASDQPAPPYNVIELVGQNGFATNLILTLGSAAADLHADAILTDVFGNVATQTVVLPGVPDTQAPSAPPFLFIAQLPDGTWLFVWGEASDDFVVDHYQIDQMDAGGNLIGTFAGGIRQNYLTTAGQDIAGSRYRVTAFDPAGNVSIASPIATASGSETAGPQIRNVLARQLPGTGTIHVAWEVDPLGTPCIAVVVDAQEQPLSSPIASSNGHATLTLFDATRPGIFRVRVSAA